MTEPLKRAAQALWSQHGVSVPEIGRWQLSGDIDAIAKTVVHVYLAAAAAEPSEAEREAVHAAGEAVKLAYRSGQRTDAEIAQIAVKAFLAALTLNAAFPPRSEPHEPPQQQPMTYLLGYTCLHPSGGMAFGRLIIDATRPLDREHIYELERQCADDMGADKPASITSIARLDPPDVSR